jgi:hypothetical protein
MNTKLTLGIIAVAAIAVMLALNSNQAPLEPSKYDDFAKCLNEKGMTIYGTDTCTYCKAQKEDFGNAFQYLDYVNCAYQGSECDAAGVTGYPTWTTPEGGKLPGKQSMDYLSRIADCPLP